MQTTALFVDLTNFYTRLVESSLLPPEELRDYFMNWFDFTALSTYLAEKSSDVWIFHSANKLGPAKVRIDGTYLSNMIDRFDRQAGVTTQNVNIAGEQREPFNVKCSQCGTETDAVWKSEKGIDSSLIVHLFDTMQYWDKAYLLSGDADFVPAVRSLRRQGKIVNGAGFTSQASSALVRECFHYEDLEAFFRQDITAYHLLANEGWLDKIFAGCVSREPLLTQAGDISKEEIEFDVEIYLPLSSNQLRFRFYCYLIEFRTIADEPTLLVSPESRAQSNYEFKFDARLFGSFQENIESLGVRLGLKAHKYTYNDTGDEAFSVRGAFSWSEADNSYVIRAY